MYWTRERVVEIRDLLGSGKFAEAADMAIDRLDGEARAAEICQLLSAAAMRRNDFGQALEWSKKGSALSPDDTTRFHVDLLRVAMRAGETDIAVKTSERVLAVEPGNSEVLRHLSTLAAKADKPDDAKAFALRSAESETATVADMVTTIRFLILADDYSEAKRILRLSEERFSKLSVKKEKPVEKAERTSSRRASAAFKRKRG